MEITDSRFAGPYWRTHLMQRDLLTCLTGIIGKPDVTSLYPLVRPTPQLETQFDDTAPQ